MTDSTRSKQPQAQTISTQDSLDTLGMIVHGSELTLNISTPVGRRFMCQTTFIGLHSNTYILTEMPHIAAVDLNTFFQMGFWSNVKAISHRGEGALIFFRSQLLYVIDKPVPLAIFSIPDALKVVPLRKEPRYDVKLPGKMKIDGHNMECEVRDLSQSGCRFLTTLLSKPLNEGDWVVIVVNQSGQKIQLEGKVCNVQRSKHHIYHGLTLSDKGKENTRQLLQLLDFNGAKLVFDSADQALVSSDEDSV